jgi:hypothetical protein
VARPTWDAAGEFSKSRNDPKRFLKPSDYGALGSEADALKAAKWVSYQSASLTPDQNGDSNNAAITRIESLRSEIEARSCSGRNRSNGEKVVSPGRSDFDGAFDMLLTFDLAEIKVLFG